MYRRQISGYISMHGKVILIRSWTECLKNKPCDVIRIREIREEVGMKTPKKTLDNPFIYDVTKLIL